MDHSADSKLVVPAAIFFAAAEIEFRLYSKKEIATVKQAGKHLLLEKKSPPTFS